MKTEKERLYEEAWREDNEDLDKYLAAWSKELREHILRERGQLPQKRPSRKRPKMNGSGELHEEGMAARLRERLAALAAFLPAFRAAEFNFGHWEGESRREGAITLPYFVLSDQATSFVDAAYRLGQVLTDFNWPAWKETPEAKRLRDDPAVLANATPEQLAWLLTVCIRQERFVEGALESAFKSGLLTRIHERVAELAATTQKSDQAESES